MAGSNKWMKYESDDGKKYAVMVNEENGEKFGFDDITTDSSDVVGTLPRGYQMRYVLASFNNGQFRRKFHVGKPDFTAFKSGSNVDVGIISGTTVSTINGSLTYAVGEKRPLFNDQNSNPSDAAGEDSGLNNGDAT